jgi:hypothetical protein
VIHRLPMAYVGDEIHHSGYNACSSCFNNPNKARKFLILPTLNSDRVYAIDLVTDPKAPRIHHVRYSMSLVKLCNQYARVLAILIAIILAFFCFPDCGAGGDSLQDGFGNAAYSALLGLWANHDQQHWRPEP